MVCSIKAQQGTSFCYRRHLNFEVFVLCNIKMKAWEGICIDQQSIMNNAQMHKWKIAQTYIVSLGKMYQSPIISQILDLM